MGLATNTIRYLLYAINLLFVATGIIIISVGITVKLYYKSYALLIENQYIYLPSVLIVIGLIIFAIAVLGCCGAIYENSFVTLMFSTFLLLIFFLEIGVGMSGYLLRNSAQKALIGSMTLPESSDNLEIANAWGRIQEDFNCCGITGPGDWKNVTGGNKLPESCCSHTKIEGTRIRKRRSKVCSSSSNDLNKTGCIYIFKEYIQDNSAIIEIVGFSLAFVQLIGIIISCHLASQFRKGYETV